MVAGLRRPIGELIIKTWFTWWYIGIKIIIIGRTYKFRLFTVGWWINGNCNSKKYKTYIVEKDKKTVIK